MAARYEQTLREQQGNLAKEDFSDMVAEHAAKQKVENNFPISAY
jgi:splicing factor 3B subunit 2